MKAYNTRRCTSRVTCCIFLVIICTLTPLSSAFSIPLPSCGPTWLSSKASSSQQNEEGRVLFRGGSVRSKSRVAPILFSSNEISAEDTSKEGNSSSSNTNRLAFFRESVLPRLFFFFALFFAGYRIGVSTGGSYIIDKTTSTVRSSTRRFPLVSTLLIFFIARDLWRSVPSWAKPRLLKRAVSDTAKLFGRKSAEDEASLEDADDMADIDTLVGKLGAILQVARTKLPKESMKDFNLQASFLALLQLVKQMKSRRAKTRDEMYAECGQNITSADLKGLPQGLEFADWAYDEDPSGKPLKELLDDAGYALLKHDKTAVPGYLGHYLAISKDPKKKTAIIGVKGTSSFEDLITDMCGAAVSYELDAPFVKGDESTKSIRAHDGILVSSRRLADDLQPFVENLLLPQGYKIQIFGHSLGAAASATLAVFLRSRIPILSIDNGKILSVLAFASPPNLDKDNALACSPFVTTIVNNCDVIPRCNISPVLSTVEVLKVINEKLREKDMDASDLKSSAALLKQLTQGSEGDMLLTSEDLTDAINNGIEKVGLDDEDHLYVPGKTVLMYDLWECEVEQEAKQVEDDGEGDEKESEEEFEYCAERAVVSDGIAKVLRYIEYDGRMVEDHMADAYRKSLRNLVSLQPNEEQEAST